MIQESISMSCEPIQMQYKAKSNDYIPIENQPLIHWVYQKLIQMNILFPWNLIGQQLDQLNSLSFLTRFHLQLISNNSWMFLIIFILIFLLIFFIISSIKALCKYKRNHKLIQKQSLIKNNNPSFWNNEFDEEKRRIYSHAIHTLQAAINNDYSSKKLKTRQILYKCIYILFLICLLLTSGFLLWMIILIIEDIRINAEIHNYIQNSSSEFLSFMKHTAFKTNCFFNSIETNDIEVESRSPNETVHKSFELNLALKGISFLTNIANDLLIHLKKLEKLFDLWFIMRLITIIIVVIFLILCGFVVYLLLKKLHWSRLKTFQYTKITSILSIVYWIGFVLWFTKLVILLPHVAGACSVCNDLKEKQIYNSLLFARKWFNSTFLLAMNTESFNIDRLIEYKSDLKNSLRKYVFRKCEQNSSLWSINDFIQLGLLKNKIDKSMNIEDIDLNRYHRDSSKYDQHFGHCQILHELHNNFTHLFCHSFVKNLLHYLITTVTTAISHLLLYLLSILLHGFIQNHKYQFGRLNVSIRSSPILATAHSMTIPSNQNKHNEIEQCV